MESYSGTIYCTVPLHCTCLHMFLARTDETHTNFTLLHMSGLAVG